TKRAPWDGIKKEEIIYFKNSGEPVIAEARVARVMQFQFKNIGEVRKVVKKYGKQIALVNRNPKTWDSLPRYAVLIWLKRAEAVKPFNIDKTGFGSAAAWLTAKNFKKV
ncbi:hypothetical protein KW785_02680, partial [Candidatus Parcubacteria bacterium]|nr:hypothetical protein [Candidatus Parcubacteria bacterium]